MPTKIEKSDLFYTPKSWDDLMAWIKLHSKEVQPHVMTAAGMAWNLACEITNKDEAENGAS